MTLITGFLGAGKTTLIRQLLEKAPANEKWAVLVNEFGDIGLDSAFYSESGVAIKEVPGGCVCCTTSAAFQQGLNQLIRQYNPDRILIEPSGLGHPKQIVQKLRSDLYQDVLLLTGVFCVLDARNLQDERYTQHEIFNDQIESANGIVLSHSDKYKNADISFLNRYFGDESKAQPALFMSNPMKLDLADLDVGLKDVLVEEKASEYSHAHSHSHEHHVASEDCLLNSPWHYQKHQDAMQVLGWRWPIEQRFNEKALQSTIEDMSILEGVYRIKGVFSIDSTEALLVNVSRGEVSFTKTPWQETSRMEVIGNLESNWPVKVKEGKAFFFS
ncbi:CobW family GTP-binding protein [Marinomonas sp. 5E14-1]|uniref:CobW family GTP-binding protein n=1 Tax=Marinomonas sp. 5E14-1 TaxID=3153922 RepID=UPI00326798DD